MKTSDNSGLIIWAFVIGIPLFLLMEHPLVFWLVFIPLVIIGVTKFITWLKK